MPTIERTWTLQFRVKIRRNGVVQTKTFETRRAAEEWARILDGKVSGDDFIDHSRARETILSQALDWYERAVVPKTPRSAKVKLGLIGYLRKSRFADWSLVALHPWDLLEWRREVLDEDNAEDGAQVGPMPISACRAASTGSTSSRISTASGPSSTNRRSTIRW